MAAGAATLATTFTAQAQTTLERAKADGYIRVGFANEAPFGFATPDGKLTGESPEVVKAVLAKMGIDAGRRRADRVRLAHPGPAGRAASTSSPPACSSIRSAASRSQFSEPTYGIGQAFLVAGRQPEGHRRLRLDRRRTPT